MSRVIAFLYGVVCYVAFLASFLYAIAFVGDFGVVPRTVNTGGPESTFGVALLVNGGLLLLFAVQHSGMARQGFKEWWTRIIPRSVERSTYVLLTSVALFLLYGLWRPMPGVVWEVEAGWARSLIWGVFWLGWALVLVSTFVINHFDLFGLRQVWLHLKREEYEPLKFRTRLFYKYVRHPLLLGFLVAFWATPTMTVGHLLFAGAVTGYTLLAIPLEERDLVRFHGEAYERYREETPALLPIPGRKAPDGLKELDRIRHPSEEPEPAAGD